MKSIFVSPLGATISGEGCSQTVRGAEACIDSCMFAASTVVPKETIRIVQDGVSVGTAVAKTIDADSPRVPVREWRSVRGQLF